MTPKEQAAMQQALEALEHYGIEGTKSVGGIKCTAAITALREALDHSSEATDMAVDWDMVKPEAIASDPLYQQGFVDGVEEGRNQVAEQAEQSQLADASLEPVAWALSHSLGIEFSSKYPMQATKEAAEQMAREHMGKVVVTPLCAAPVCTKDLTVDEKVALADRLNLNGRIVVIDAVIAAYKEKNK